MFSLPFVIKQSIQIDKPLEEVFSVVSNFNTWHHWSPWLCMEPDCPLEIIGNAGETEHGQKWNGKRIGEGEMHLKAISPSKSLDYDLIFIKPWKSQSKVRFDFEAKSNGTLITWHMQGSIPIFLFFMRKMMTAMVGSDYQRGLNMLKEFLETGSVNSKINFIGEVSREGFYYLGKHRKCGTDEVGTAMEQDFAELEKLLSEDKLVTPEFMCSFYRQYDLVNKNCEYTSAVAYLNKPAPVEGLESGEVAAHQALNIEHIGPYKHLGNAWSTIQSMLRASKKKQSKSIPMYEIYLNFPGQIEDKEIKTALHMPLK